VRAVLGPNRKRPDRNQSPKGCAARDRFLASQVSVPFTPSMMAGRLLLGAAIALRDRR